MTQSYFTCFPTFCLSGSGKKNIFMNHVAIWNSATIFATSRNWDDGMYMHSLARSDVVYNRVWCMEKSVKGAKFYSEHWRAGWPSQNYKLFIERSRVVWNIRFALLNCPNSNISRPIPELFLFSRWLSLTYHVWRKGLWQKINYLPVTVVISQNKGFCISEWSSQRPSAVHEMRIYSVSDKPILPFSKLDFFIHFLQFYKSREDLDQYKDLPVMSSSEKVDFWMCSKNPESVMLSSKCLNSSPLAHIPHSDAFVFRVWDDDVLACMEHNWGDIVYVTSQCIYLPRLCICNQSKSLQLSFEHIFTYSYVYLPNLLQSRLESC